MLAGQLIERVTSSTYAEEVCRRIVRPLGLTGTSVPGLRTTPPEPHARHYSPLMVPGGRPHDVTELNPSYAWAAGGIVSTLADLTRFLTALLGGELLPPVRQRQLSEEAPGSSYGLGIARWPLRGGDVWGHNGMIHGSFTIAAGARDGSRVVAVNVNSDERDFSIEEFSELFAGPSRPATS